MNLTNWLFVTDCTALGGHVHRLNQGRAIMSVKDVGRGLKLKNLHEDNNAQHVRAQRLTVKQWS